MNKPGDIVMTFGDPINCKYPIGQAKLIQKLSEGKSLEQWQIEYLDDEGHFYESFIKKTNGTDKTQENSE